MKFGRVSEKTQTQQLKSIVGPNAVEATATPTGCPGTGLRAGWRVPTCHRRPRREEAPSRSLFRAFGSQRGHVSASLTGSATPIRPCPGSRSLAKVLIYTFKRSCNQECPFLNLQPCSKPCIATSGWLVVGRRGRMPSPSSFTSMSSSSSPESHGVHVDAGFRNQLKHCPFDIRTITNLELFGSPI